MTLELPSPLPLSISKLHEFEQRCPSTFYRKHILKEPTVALYQEAMDRGTAIHATYELYLRQDPAQPDNPAFMSPQCATELDRLRAYPEQLIIEELMSYDLAADLPHPVTFRLKMDCMFIEPELDEALIIDFKTGKWKGNEVKHADQTLFYAYFVSQDPRFTHLKYFHTQIWYHDHPNRDPFTITYTPTQLAQYKPMIYRRLSNILLSDFQPTPNPQRCRWCDFKLTCEVSPSYDPPLIPTNFT